MQQNKTNKKILLVDCITRREKISRFSNVEYRTNHKMAVLYSGLKMSGVFVFAVMIIIGLSSIGSTVSYFNDVETSVGNLLRGGTLDFDVALLDPELSNIKLTAGEQAVTIIPSVFGGAGDFPLAYKVHVEKTGGTSQALCDAIDLTASSTSFTYSGKLMNFTEGTTTSLDPLELNISLPADSVFTLADSCLVDVVYSGWVDGKTEGIEYHDEERVSLVIFDPPVETISAPETTSVDEPTVLLSTESEITEKVASSPEPEENPEVVSEEISTPDPESTPDVTEEITPEPIPEPVAETPPPTSEVSSESSSSDAPETLSDPVSVTDTVTQ